MPLEEYDFKVIPGTALEWERFFGGVRIEADTVADDAVTETTIADDAVTTTKIAASAVNETRLAADAVTTTKIVDANVTADKLASNAVTAGKIDAGAVDTAELATGAVETAKIDDRAVTYAKIEEVAADRILGRLTSAGDAQELTATQVRDLLLEATTITDAETSHSLNATFSNTEVEAALDALGAKINLILDELLKST